MKLFSSLSESGFIPTLQSARNTDGLVTIVLISFREWLHSYKDLLKLLREELENVLISFREWLHSYDFFPGRASNALLFCSHLFQRVASFLHRKEF